MPQGYPSKRDDQPEELRRIVQLVKERKDRAEQVHKPYRDRWDQYYGLYRNYRRLQAKLKGAAERDRDAVLLDARREWGAELFIPYCFGTVETIVPRVISRDPKMIVPPKKAAARDASQRVQELFDVDQRAIDYDLKLQAVARQGLKYGLGVGKTYWEREARRVMQRQPRRFMPGYQAVETEIVLREGPQFEPVNIWDFLWEPSATCMENCEWVIHRTWRPFAYVRRKVESGEWLPIDLDAVEKMGSENAWTETHGPRLEMAGMPNLGTQRGKLHEIWECHDRDGNVYTILNGELCVQNDKTPFWHRELPFQIYRPTPQEHEFVGIGEIEPIAHLQYELNTLRSQRRDNATLVMQKAFMYAEGFVDPDLLKIGPGRGIPVRGQNLRDLIIPLEFGEIPASGYQEENAIKEDIERTSGVSDAVAGGDGGGASGSETATGIQLIQAAANVRIALKTKNLLAETVRPAGRQWLELYRQHVDEPRDVRVPDASVPEGYRFTEVGPEQLLSDLDAPEPEGGSTEPDNPVQRRQDALALYNAFGQSQVVDQHRLVTHVLREFGLGDAEQYVLDPTTVPVDPRVLGEQLAAMGIPQEMVLQALDAALAAATGQGEPELPMVEEEPSAQEQTDSEEQ